MNGYHLLALDMDGTLLDSRKQVTPRTREALAGLARQGVAVAFCTGRNAPEVAEYREALPFVRYAVLLNGAVVYDFAEQREVFRNGLAHETAQRLVHLGVEARALVQVLSTTHSVEAAKDYAHIEDFHQEAYRELIGRLGTLVDDVSSWLGAHPGEAVKINLHHRSIRDRDRSLRLLEKWPLEVARGETTSLECTAAGVSKAEGLGALAEHLGLTLNDAVAVGDGGNDSEVLAAAGMPVAMGNATDEIKALARLVVADNDHDGIAEVVERLF